VRTYTEKNTRPDMGLLSKIGVEDETKVAQPLQWSVPRGWQELEADGMRAGAFQGAHQTQTTIISLTGDGGGLTGNLSRWAGQIGVKLTSQQLQQLSQNTEKVTGHHVFQLYDFAPYATEQGSILGAVSANDNTTLFVKMTGAPEDIAKDKQGFTTLLTSISGHTAPVKNARRASELNAMQMPADHPPLTSGTAGLQWNTPSGWQQLGPTGMRLATFIIEGTSAEIALMKLGGSGGALDANIIRWANQLGITYSKNQADSLAAASKHSMGDLNFTLYDFTPATQNSALSILVGVSQLPETSLFVKATGPTEVLLQHKQKFIELLSTMSRSS